MFWKLFDRLNVTSGVSLEHLNILKVSFLLCASVSLLSDAKCGKIQCHSAAKKPKGTNAVSIDTTIETDGVKVKCRGTYVYSTQDGQGDLPDPGLVMTGTKCGEGKVGADYRIEYLYAVISQSGATQACGSESRRGISPSAWSGHRVRVLVLINSST